MTYFSTAIQQHGLHKIVLHSDSKSQLYYSQVYAINLILMPHDVRRLDFKEADWDCY